MMTLTEFLLARIAEDQADAELAIRNQEPGEPWGCDTVPGEGLQLARWSPARVLAECEAKRQIVNRSKMLTAATYASGIAFAEILTLLALPYTDHPDYDEEWRP